MAESTKQEKDLRVRIERLRENTKKAHELLENEEASKFDVQRMHSRLVDALPPIERHDPVGAASPEAVEFWSANVLPIILDATEMISDLKVVLDLAKARPSTRVNDNASINEILEGMENCEINETPKRNDKAQRKHGTSTPAPNPHVPTYVPKHLDVQLPNFNGNCSDYTSFLAAYKAYTRAVVDPEIRFLVLANHLKDSAALFVRGLNPSQESLDRALLEMDRFYNDKNRIIDDLERKLFNLKEAADTAEGLRSTYLEIESLLRALEQHGVDVSDNRYRRLVLTKYPERVRTNLNPNRPVTMDNLRRDLVVMIDQKSDLESAANSASLVTNAPLKEHEMKEILAYPAVKNEKKKGKERDRNHDNDRNQGRERKRDDRNRNRDRNADRGKREPKCTYCKESHYSSECSKFPTADDRRKALPNDMCYLCLYTGHKANECRSRISCFYCRKPGHHSSMCYEQFPASEKKKEVVSESKDAPKEKRTIAMAVKDRSRLMTGGGIVQNPRTGVRIMVRIFFDPGAEDTYILEHVAGRLRLTVVGYKDVDLCLFNVAETKNLKTKTVELELLSASDPNFKLRLRADLVDKLPHIVTSDVEEFKSEYPLHADLEYADPMNDREVSLMVGIDYCWDLLRGKPPIDVAPGLHLIPSVFGWVICGRMRSEVETNIRLVNTACTLQQAVSKLWEVEALGIRDPDLSKEKEEEIALDLFRKNIRYDATEKRYEVGWPWRSYPPPIPTNYGLAIGILRSLHRRTKPAHLEVIYDTLKTQEETGIIERVSNPKPTVGKTNYLPYHLVVKEDVGSSTPVRMVFNGSAKTSKAANSLNESLYKGLNLLPDLVAILLRSRFGRFLVTSDIEKAFHQLLIREEDRDYLRFLVQGENDEIETYRFRRVPFGIISSPFMLAAVIHEILNTSHSSFTETIKENLYVDNLVITHDTTDDAIALQKEAIEIFEKCSMNLRKWTSNSPKIRELTPTDKCEDAAELSILGAQWNRDRDTFSFPAPSPATLQLKHTMRSVLKVAASVFDPLGLFAPVTIRAKMILRTCHERKAGWDGELTAEESRLWEAIHQDLVTINNVEIQRRIHECTSPQNRYSYHVFSDASKNVFATAVYIRIESNANDVTTKLVFAKARSAPLKKVELTIPKLELLAAVISTKALNIVRTALHVHEAAPAQLYIDSRCVLAWLKSRATLTTFVKNRVAKIRETENVNYRYIPSAENIADLPTRFATLPELCDNEKWWNGPPWLQLAPECWPQDTKADEYVLAAEELETERNVLPVVFKTQPSWPLNIDPTKFNSYQRLIRVTAIALKFLATKIPKFASKCTANFHDEATLLWIRRTQSNGFYDTFTILKSQGRPSKFMKHTRPYLDELRVLRFGGRFGAAPLSIAERHPIILPKASSDPFTKLLVLNIHSTLKHAGPNTTLAAFQKRYWMPQGRKEIYSVIRKCPPCSREIARPYDQPSESHLPKFRLQPGVRPFASSGLDICGPFTILGQKKWILLLTCLVMRGVALEVLDTMETVHIYDALRRIAARRTLPTLFLSDNAAQFRLLAAHLIQNANHEIEWRNIPQYSPWYGGAYERLNAILKTSLYRTVNEYLAIGPVQFRTIVAEVEAAVNSRPLTAVTAVPELKVLTPNDLLQVGFTEEFANSAAASNTKAAKVLAEMSRKVDHAVAQFWRDWKTTYLQYLRERSATQNFQGRRSGRTPKVNDIVIIKDDLRKRANWKLGKIEALTRSADGAIRSATVKLATGNFVMHPVKDLFPLEIDDDEPTGETNQDDDPEIEELGVSDLNAS